MPIDQYPANHRNRRHRRRRRSQQIQLCANGSKCKLGVGRPDGPIRAHAATLELRIEQPRSICSLRALYALFCGQARKIHQALKAGLWCSPTAHFQRCGAAFAASIARGSGAFTGLPSPHLVFYLKIDVDTLIRRVLSARGMDFWESGMDLKGGDDIYDSFRSYQNKLLREHSGMADEFGFRVLDARRPVDVLQQDLRRQVQAFLSSSDIGTDTSPLAETARPATP